MKRQRSRNDYPNNDTGERKTRTGGEVEKHALTFPRSVLTDQEIDELRHAYQKGATGSVLIGLKGRTRMLTLHLPHQRTQQSADQQKTRIIAQLKSIGSDGFILIQVARKREKKESESVDGLLIEANHRGKSIYEFKNLTISPNTG